ncbi:MAG: NADH-quinone oxidoreductase subunit J [Bacteroidia bacterium]|nr:NADH-quinone oxidoreductase subunit J [Bacteroidia bacterium]
MEIVFYLFLGITLLAGIFMAVTRNLMHAALSLFIVLFGVAALFVFAGADFPAVSQLILYIGGVLVLIIFGVMLTQRKLNEPPLTGITQPFWGIAIPVVMMMLMGGIFFLKDWENSTWILESQNTLQMKDSVNQLGVQTLTNYLVPFEVLSVLLLIALVGAAYLARNEKKIKL